MAEVEKSVLVPYSAQEMFALVDAVEQYPQFLPWCGGTQLLLRDSTVTRATIRIKYRGISQSFSTENTKQPPHQIDLRLIDGPFKSLDGSWRFTELGGGCKIELRLHYQFASRMLEKLIGPVFDYIANSLVDAFVKRARALYG